MCNLYSITTNQEAIRALFRVMNRYVGNLAPMPGVFPVIFPQKSGQGQAAFSSISIGAIYPMAEWSRVRL